MNEFLDMGGYAAFVWPCFGLALIVMIWNFIAAQRLHSTAKVRALRRSSAGKRVS